MRPRRHGFLYQEALREARLAEELGFDVMWLGEHHHAYDGYCPSTITAASYLAAGTSRIKFGAGVLILPHHGADRVAQTCAAFQAVAPGRLRVALGAGSWKDEFGADGIELRDRFRIYNHELDRLVVGDCAERMGATEIWSGQTAPAGYRRAGRYGLPVYMSCRFGENYEHFVDEYRNTRAIYESEWTHSHRSKVHLHCETWIEEDPRKAEWIRRRMVEMFRNYAVNWVDDPDRFGGVRVDGFDAQWEQMGMMSELALRRSPPPIVGSPAEIIERTAPLVEAGVDGVTFRVRFDGIGGHELERCLERLATEVVPELRKLAR
jgi:alkanesulfonate monooxygenase SsuD/methylene tetrahydromethanopterin reductase-like flavin-dependent oxidoreductase (luciferase family)